MEILKIPFHAHLNIQKSTDEKYTFLMEQQEATKNHLGTVHACAQLALAEATSGQFLLEKFKKLEKMVVPVIRSTRVKYYKTVHGNIYSKAAFNEGTAEEHLIQFEKKRRILTSVKVRLYNEKGPVDFNGRF